MTVAVSESIKTALDGLIFKGQSNITEKERKKNIAGIIRHHAKYENWTGYRQLNRVSLEDLIEMLTKGYHLEESPVQKELKKYQKQLNISYDFIQVPFQSLSNIEAFDYGIAQGYIRAVQSIHASGVNISEKPLPKEGDCY